MKQFLLGAASVIGLGAIAGFGYIQNGGLDFAADRTHSDGVTKLIAWAREQSITRQAKDIVPPEIWRPESVFAAVRATTKPCALVAISPLAWKTARFVKVCIPFRPISP